METLELLVNSAMQGIVGLESERFAVPDHRWSDWYWVKARLCRVWPIVETMTEEGNYRQHVALTGEVGARGTKIEKLSAEHVAAARLTLETLLANKVNGNDVSRCARAWYKAKVSVTPDFGPVITQLLEDSRDDNYDVSIEIDADLISELKAIQEEKPEVLEECTGLVSRVDHRRAFCSFFEPEGEVVTWFDADVLANQGIGPDDYFTLRTLKSGAETVQEFTFMPPRELTPEEHAKIDRMADALSDTP